MELTRDQRLYLRALAHNLKPVVMIGNQGLTDAVIREVAINLEAHELIKVRVLGDDRELRETWYAELAEHLQCAQVQHIGKLLVLYRPAGEPRIVFPKGKAKAAEPAKTKPAVVKPPRRSATPK